MLHPTIEELTKGEYNRYELALATAKCARLITDEYVRQHDAAEKSITGNKETDRPLNTMIDRELRDEKAVQVAITRIYRGAYEIDPQGNTKKADESAEEASLEIIEALDVTQDVDSDSDEDEEEAVPEDAE